MNINEHFFSIHFYTIYINIMLLVLMKYEDKLIVLFIIV